MNERNPAKLRFVKIGWVALLFCIFLLWWYADLLINLTRPSLIRMSILPQGPSQELIQPDTFSYPTLGITAPITDSPNTSPLISTDWRIIGKALRSGVSLSYDNNDFSAARLVFITGHSSDTIRHPYASIFAGLGQSRIGDTFLFRRHDDQLRYRVIGREIIDPANLEAFRLLEPDLESPPRAVLVTCWPPLTTLHRLVLIGERVGGAE